MGVNTWNTAHPKECALAKAKYLKKLRKLSFELLGNQCISCNNKDVRVLQIDHINGGGGKERKSISTYGIYKKIIAGEKNGYQLLCANCHQIKSVEAKELGNG